MADDAETEVGAKLDLQQLAAEDGEVGLDLAQIAEQLREGVEIKDRRYHMKSYKSCFVGSEAVKCMLDKQMVINEEDAIQLGNVLVEAGVFAHVLRDHGFKNEYLFYRFAVDEDHGKAARTSEGNLMSWRHFITTPTTQNESSASLRQPHLRPSNVDGVTATPASALAPLDEHNIALLDKVHPPQWSNPNAKPLYDLVVIGAGAGGLVTSAAASGVGAKVALIEKHLMGGDCLNVGCVPSKALLKAAKTAHTLRKAIDDEAELGVSLEGSVKVDFEKVMLRVRRLRAEIADADSVSRFADKLGVDVFLGAGQFVDRNTVVVNGQELRFIKCVIATGGSPALPDIPGLQAAYANQTQSQPVILTNENLFNRTVLPPRLAVIGAGAIGMEMAQAFERLGSKVTVLARSGRILPKEDRDVADLIQTCLHKEGIDFQLDVAKYTNVVATEDVVTLSFSTHGGVQQQLEVDAVLVAAGRRPNVGSLNCEAADVKYDAVNGIQVNDRLQSSNDAIFAVGDVCSRYQFTHASDFMARMVVRNTLFFGGDKFSNLLIPWSTYTSPEVAHVGAYAEDLDAQEVAYDVYEKRLDSNDRCILEGETEGLIRIVCKRGSDKIIGATIVGPNAGDMISEITLAMQAEVGLGTLASVIHPYPTRADAIRALGDQYNRTRLTPMVRRLLRGVVRFHRTGRSASK